MNSEKKINLPVISYFKMKTKLKLLFLALLGLILIPNTNAYELGVNLNWTNANYDVEYKDAKFTLYNSSYPYIVAYPCSNSSQGSKCFSAPYYSSVIFDYSYSIHVSLDSYSFNKFFGVAYKDNWEWRDFYHSVYSSDNKAVQKIFNTPSRTAFSVKMTNGKEYIMDTVYFYHNTLVFMDSRNGFTLYLNGNLKASDWVVFVDPFLKEDNLFFIRFKEKKAWSMTVSETEAWNWFFWKKSSDVLKTLKFTKSYEVREGGETIFPINFHVWKDKQGWLWYTYQEDIEFTAPDWNAGKPNNWTGNQVAQNYRACVARRSDIKILAQISKTCGDDPADEETLNWVKVDSWNWEWEAKTIIDQLTGKNKTKCGRYANTKKKYHDKYSKEWESFSKDFNNYAFTPEAIDVQAQCRWEELEQEHWSAGASPWEEWKHVFSWMINWNKSLAEVLSDERNKVLTGNDEISFTQWDYLEDTKYLRDLFNQCNWLTFGWLYQDKSSEDRLYYCSLYESFKQTLLVKYAGVDFKKAKLKSLDDLIKHLDNIKNKWVISTFTTELKERIKEPFSEVWTKLYSYIQDPYVSWYNHWLFVSCSGNVHIEWMDIFAYILFLMVVFTLLRYI